MKPSRLWDFLFVYSNYHLEHHYFPRVPFYNLRKVHMRLRPLYDRLGLKPHTYREIVWQWFVLNRAPHTDWEHAAVPPGPPSPATRDDRATPVTHLAPLGPGRGSHRHALSAAANSRLCLVDGLGGRLSVARRGDRKAGITVSSPLCATLGLRLAGRPNRRQTRWIARLARSWVGGGRPRSPRTRTGRQESC